MCDLLGGTISDQNGNLVCTYNKYTEKHSSNGGGVSEMPYTVELATLPDDAADYQYFDVLGRRGNDVKERLIKLMNK